MNKKLKRRETMLTTCDLINAEIYKNELAYANAKTLVETFGELKAVRNVCANKVNEGPEDGDYAPRINPELLVEWMDLAMDIIEKRHNETIKSTDEKPEPKELTLSAWAVI